VLCILPRLEHGHTERAVVGALALAAAVVSAVAHALGADAAARAREHVLGDEVVVVAAKDRWIHSGGGHQPVLGDVLVRHGHDGVDVRLTPERSAGGLVRTQHGDDALAIAAHRADAVERREALATDEQAEEADGPRADAAVLARQRVRRVRRQRRLKAGHVRVEPHTMKLADALR